MSVLRLAMVKANELRLVLMKLLAMMFATAKQMVFELEMPWNLK